MTSTAIWLSSTSNKGASTWKKVMMMPAWRWLQVSHVSAQDTFTLLVDPSSRRRPGGYTWAPDAACSPIVVWRSPGLLSATKPKIVFLKPGIIRSRRKRKAYSNWSWRAVFKNSIWSKHELNHPLRYFTGEATNSRTTWRMCLCHFLGRNHKQAMKERLDVADRIGIPVITSSQRLTACSSTAMT